MTAPTDAALDEDTLVGRVVEGRFHVLGRLAAGGMGVVYKAEQQPLGRLVALKILELSSGLVDDSFSQRFFLEASAAAKLGHPNTIVVHDYGKTSDGLYFIAMEYLDGGTLSHRLKSQGPLQPPDAIHVAMQVASSLRDAHAQGLVHRDLKPGNVMFAPRGGDPLFIKVLDFGLVKVVGEGQNLNLTQSGVMMGSPRYMSPEQVKSKPVDARTDIYSFGAVFFHALTGRPPFSAGSAFEAMNHHVYTAAPSFREVWSQCPAGPQLEAVVRRCLEKDPASRYQTMDEVMQALRACAAEAGASASVGSYLGVGSTSSADAPTPAPPQVTPAPVAAPAPAGDKPASQKTLLYQPTPSFPAPAPAPTPAPLPAPAPQPKGGGLKLVLGALVLLLSGAAAGVSAWLLFPMGDDAAEPTEPADLAPEPAPEPVAVAPAPEPHDPAPEPTEAAAEPQPLMLRTDPSGATVRRDGAELGDTPIPLVIEPGERWTVEISHEGYETRSVTLLGGQPELTVHLDPAAARPTSGRRRQPPVPEPTVRPLGPAPPPRGGPVRPDPRAPELDNPWAR